MALRIAHVGRDAAFQCLRGGVGYAAGVVASRRGKAFDPAVAAALADDADEILAVEPGRSAWAEALALEPEPHLVLEDAAIDEALAAMGDFADLLAPELTGHSSGVARLAAAAAARAGLSPGDVAAVRRAGLVHDVGRVAVDARTWRKPAPLTPDEWEGVRLHAYHTDRVLSRSPFLACPRADRLVPPRAARRLGLPPRSDGAAASPPRRGCWPPPTPSTR